MFCQHPLAARQKLHSYFFPIHTRKTYEISVSYSQIQLPLHIYLDGRINQVWVSLWVRYLLLE